MKPAILPFLATLILALPLSAHSFELEHSDGHIQLKTAPKRLVSYDLAVVDTLHALKIPVAGVPRMQAEGTLAGLQDVPTVGTLFEPDYEALSKLKPDLIFAGGRSQKEVPKLSKVAPVAVFNADHKAWLSSFAKNNLALARAFGKEKEAQVLVDAIKQNTDKLHQHNKGKTGAFLFTINGAIMPHSTSDRFGYTYELSGLKSVVKPSPTPSGPRPAPGSPEAIAAQKAREETIADLVKADPDWLLVLDRGAINGGEKTAQQTLAKHPLLSQSKAFKEGRVIYVAPNPWYVVSGGLANVKQISEELLEQMVP